MLHYNTSKTEAMEVPPSSEVTRLAHLEARLMKLEARAEYNSSEAGMPLVYIG